MRQLCWYSQSCVLYARSVELATTTTNNARAWRNEIISNNGWMPIANSSVMNGWKSWQWLATKGQPQTFQCQLIAMYNTVSRPILSQHPRDRWGSCAISSSSLQWQGMIGRIGLDGVTEGDQPDIHVVPTVMYIKQREAVSNNLNVPIFRNKLMMRHFQNIYLVINKAFVLIG